MDDGNTFEVVVVGAGPHALALLSRLFNTVPDKYEERPSNEALFTFKSPGKVHAKIKDSPRIQRTHRQIYSYLNSKSKSSFALNRICIIDRHGCWLKQWAKQFDILEIFSLRSTLSVHPDAFDLNSLNSYAIMKKRENELIDISREIRGSKFNGPFIIPSAPLFFDFCEHIINKYGLADQVQKAVVQNIEKCCISKESKLYKLTLSTGKHVYCNNVVFCTGNTSVKRMPQWAEELYEEKYKNVFHSSDIIGYSTAMGIGDRLPNSCLSQYLPCGKGNTTVIIGGGLTSGHLAIRAAQGYQQVHLICRSMIKVRQFDLDLEWIGRSRFKKLAEFFSMECYEDRHRVLLSARNGGSITPLVYERLLELKSSGILQIHECAEVWSQNIQMDSDGNALRHVLELSNGFTISTEQIILATGSLIDMENEPLLQKVAKLTSVPMVNGLPVLTEDLECGENSGIFVMGAYAALQLGPDALNVAGARGGASRVGHKLKKLMFSK